MFRLITNLFPLAWCKLIANHTYMIKFRSNAGIFEDENKKNKAESNIYKQCKFIANNLVLVDKVLDI